MGMKSFCEWCEFLNLWEVVQTYRKPNPKQTGKPDKDFLVLFGNLTDEIKAQIEQINKDLNLGKWGFKGYAGTTSIFQFMIDSNPEILQRLAAIGVDLTGYEMGTAQAKADEIQRRGHGESETDQILQKMDTEIEQALSAARGKQEQQILTVIDSAIDRLSAMADEEAKSEFVKKFLAFSKNFWHYSFLNQLLIYAQNPDASYVNAEGRWSKMGRFIDDGKRKLPAREGGPIMIRAPREYKKKDYKTGKVIINPDTGEEEKGMSFKYVKVWDMSSTYVAPGMEGKADVFEPNDWRQDSNENREEITAMINAGIALAGSLDIKVDTEKLGTAGGYSAGGRIAINDTYDGINKFTTLVHELAHEILHHNISKEDKLKSSRADMEYDAESTAYVVSNYYGFYGDEDTTDSARYIALWKGDSATIKLRAAYIQRAAKQIIEGINKQMTKMDIDFGDDEETPAAAA